MDTQGKYYLGRIFDPKAGKATDQPVLYDPNDLTTHAVVVGMTGSGKTGLCIGMLEEAALNGLPALMIDPKGDITNLLLHFPNLLPQDFLPWVNADEARRSGKSVEQVALETAALWKKGLSDWGIDQDRIQALQKAVNFAVYTPGSESGIPVSILASLKAPPISWESNREILREKIVGTVTALLGLVGYNDIDPVRSREHILLSNIFENAWSQGRDLDLGELILQTQTPPFSKLGVFDVNTFFPEKNRFELAMTLNNILASPAFQAWIEGQPLDIPSLLFAPDGRPRHSVFYIAHLSDAERMFFVTLLFSAVEAWMRTQSGTTSLRSLLYFDEIYGYLPPISNPPSKPPMMRMLKQARAFGVGLVLVTQNPVDLDYKALSNTGTWMIGKLQTDQDKQRLLDGLQGAVAGNMDRAAYDNLISTLGKRVFLVHNVHNPPGREASLMQTRWCMNYLAGPLSRTQVPALNQLVGAQMTSTSAQATPESSAATTFPTASAIPSARPASTPAPGPAASIPTSSGTVATRPPVPAGVAEYFLPNNLSFNQALKASGQAAVGEIASQGMVYKPVLFAQASVRFLNRSYNLDFELRRTALVANPDRRGMVRWEDFPSTPIDERKLDSQPDPRARFVPVEAPLSDARLIAAMQKDFLDWVFRTGEITVQANETLKVYAGPDVSTAQFRQMCADAARQGRDEELRKAGDSFDKKLATLQDRMAREQRELDQDQTKLSQRRMEELGTAAETVFGLFSGRKSSRRISSSLSKHRMASEAKASVEESKATIADLQKQIAQLQKDKQNALDEVSKRWSDLANQSREIKIVPQKKDILLDLFGIAWMPCYVVQMGGQTVELAGYAAAE